MYLKEYEWVKQNRETLLDFCSKIESNDYNRNIDGFGTQNVRDTLLHVANCYHAWIGSFILVKTKEPIIPIDERLHFDPHEIKQRFREADEYVYELFETFEKQMDVPIQREIPWRNNGQILTITPRKLLFHTISHEYHHKGQIVSMVRQMGYVPPNTDVLGTED